MVGLAGLEPATNRL